MTMLTEMKVNSWVLWWELSRDNNNRPIIDCRYAITKPELGGETAWWWEIEHWRSDAELATTRSRGLHAILDHYEWAGKKYFVSLKFECQGGGQIRDSQFYRQAALTTAPGPPPQTSLVVRRENRQSVSSLKKTCYEWLYSAWWQMTLVIVALIASLLLVLLLQRSLL